MIGQGALDQYLRVLAVALVVKLSMKGRCIDTLKINDINDFFK